MKTWKITLNKDWNPERGNNWWDISNNQDAKKFRCDDEKSAQWLCDLLNAFEEPNS